MVQTYIMSGNKSNFTTKYSPNISLDPKKQYEAALLSIDLYNSIPNITEENNTFRYSVDKGKSWKNIKLGTGSYELSTLNTEIQRMMAVNGDYDSVHQVFYIDISANITKLTSIVNITNENYKVDFRGRVNIGSVLGYSTEVIGFGYNESPKIVDIMKVNAILVNVDIIVGSYVNGSNSPAIYSFAPSVSPGYKIVERPTPSLTFYPVSRYEINSMNVWLTDQNNKAVDLRGETITVRICIREAPFALDDIRKAIEEFKK